MAKTKKYPTFFSVYFDEECLREKDTFYVEEDLCFNSGSIGKQLSEVSSRIKAQDNFTPMWVACNNFDRMIESEEDKKERERRDEESRLSIEEFDLEHKKRVAAYRKTILIEERKTTVVLNLQRVRKRAL